MILNANALHLPIASETVQCIVTSPPYYGLRDYGTAKWICGDPDCDHRENDRRSTRAQGAEESFHGGDDTAQTHPYKSICAKCGAIRVDNQIGLEPTPQAYVDNLVAVFRECWRVLKPDGVAWLNLGDSYANNGVSDPSKVGGFTGDRIRRGVKGTMDSRPKSIPDGLKPKDLIGIPWRVAFALQSDGWWLRQDIIWHKPNPMPESVTDRCTKAHEYVFLLTKSARYFYDAEAIQEKSITEPVMRDKNSEGYNKCGYPGGERFSPGARIGDGTRNKRSVWNIATRPFSGAHFACMPPELAETCIKAGSRRGDLVFDPFSGSGTTWQEAIRLGRKFIGTELNYKYIHDVAPLRTSSIQVVML